MRVTLFILAGLVGVYILTFLIDILTTSETSPEEIALAHQYLEKEELPTPPLKFYEDGCTAWPDVLPWHDFREACFSHDIAYWAGGEEWRKEAADAEFAADIRESGPLGPLFATIMYSGVDRFGDSFLTRALGAEWGYGWSE